MKLSRHWRRWIMSPSSANCSSDAGLSFKIIVHGNGYTELSRVIKPTVVYYGHKMVGSAVTVAVEEAMK